MSTLAFMNRSIIFITAILSCYMAFLNGYPLVYSDTGSYIFSGFTNTVLIDRPLTYGLFLRHLSLNESMWINVMLQALLLSYLLFLVYKYFSGKSQFTGAFLVFYLSILCLTGVSVNVSQLMPDVFTPMVILSSVLLLIAENLSKWDRVCIGLIFVLSVIMHNSHFAIVALFLCFAVLLHVVLWFKKKRFFLPLKRLLLLFTLLVLSWFSVASLHYSYGGGFKISRGSSVFYLNHLLEIGVLEPFLKEECGNQKWSICAYQDKFPPDFLWDETNSPLYKRGGWEKNSEEYSQIIKAIFKKPFYIKRILLRSIEGSLQQFFMFKVEHPPVLRENSSVYGALHWFWRADLRQYLSSKQANNRLNFDLLNFFQYIFILVSIAITVYLYSTNRLNAKMKNFTFLLVVFVFSNAFVMAFLSVPIDRYQSRVIWLLVLPVYVFFTQSGFFDRLLKRNA